MNRITKLLVFSAAILCTMATPAQTAQEISAQKPGATVNHAGIKSLPKVFASVLSEVKTKSHVAILLPSELPDPVGKAEHAGVDKATANEYVISLYYELDAGDAGFAALFSGDAAPKYDPKELRNIREVELAHGIHGFVRAAGGRSRGPVNIWWKDGGTLYQIQMKLDSSLSGEGQEKAIVAVANSAILGGPR